MIRFMSMLLIGLLSGCGQAPEPAQNAGGKKTVVCTTTMIADLARRIAGDRLEIQGIMKTGEDPHVYDVRPRDAQMIAAADLVLINGLHLEATLGEVIEHHAKAGRVVKLGEHPEIKPLASQTAQGAPDPHCWFNLRYFSIYAKSAVEALAKLDPAHESEYRHRGGEYLEELAALDQWVRQELSRTPKEQRVMVTSHDAFQYFGAEYEVEVHAVIGISTEQQPRPQDVEALEKLVRRRSVKALFIETSVSATLNQIVRKVAAATGAKIGGQLYSDSLGEPGTEAGTYLGMVRHNVKTLVAALK